MSQLYEKLIKISSYATIKGLIVYLCIACGCIVAIVYNLFSQNVGFSALSNGIKDEKDLFLLSSAIICVCILFIAFIFYEIHLKKQIQKGTIKRRK